MPTPNNVTRFPGGMNNLLDNDVFANLLIQDWGQMHSFLEDFDLFLATMWSVGGVGTPTRALAAGDGGIVAIGNSAANGDNSWIQGSIGYTLTSPNTKRVFFAARAAVDDATNGVVALGLQIAVAGNNFLTPVNGIFFLKAAAGTSMVLRNRAASVTTDSASLGSVVANQQFEVAFAIDLNTLAIIAAFQPDTSKGPAQVVSSIVPAALPTVAMGVTAAVQNGTAAARTLNLDQIFAAKER